MSNKTRQERIENGTLVPNSFQHPNLYVDWLHYYLTPEEAVVLDKAVREILGWEENISDRKARIALSIFVGGKVSRKDGRQLCMGCGLGIQAVRNALDALNTYRILVKEGVPTQQGQMWCLQDKVELIDWEGLERRREKWDEKNSERTKRATKASLASRGVTSDVRGNVPRNPNPLWSGPEQTTTSGVPSDVSLTSDVDTLVTSDANNETQRDLYINGNNKDLQGLWSPVLDRLSIALDRGTFDTWLKNSRLVGATNGTWTVELQHPAAVAWVANRLYPSRSFQGAIEDLAPQVEHIEFIVKEKTA